MLMLLFCRAGYFGMKTLFITCFIGLILYVSLCFAQNDQTYRRHHGKPHHHKRHHHRSDVQFSASPAEVAAANRRLNSGDPYGGSLYYRDLGSPYDPNSMFNRDFCSNYPNDPGCYNSMGMQFSIPF
jgi:hypothetical protein